MSNEVDSSSTMNGAASVRREADAVSTLSGAILTLLLPERHDQGEPAVNIPLHVAWHLHALRRFHVPVAKYLFRRTIMVQFLPYGLEMCWW